MASLLLVAFKEKQSQLESGPNLHGNGVPHWICVIPARLLLQRGSGLESFDFQKHLRYSFEAAKGQARSCEADSQVP